MTTPEALAFLQQWQPLPKDEILEQNLVIIETYDAVIKHFITHPDPQCVALFLNSFGGRNGLGAYQMVENALYLLDYDFVVQALAQNVGKGAQLTQPLLYWNVNLCTPFVDVALREPLAHVLTHPDEDIRLAAIGAISLINDRRSYDLLAKQLFVEVDEYVIDFLHEMLAEMDMQGSPPR